MLASVSAIANFYGLAIRSGKDHHGDGDEKSPITGGLNVRTGNLSISHTSPTSVTFQAYVNFTNPTNYSATVPYFNINIVVNGTVVGQAIAENLEVRPGNNTNMVVSALWDPYTNGGDKGRDIGREFLSQYISGIPHSTIVHVIPTNPPHQASTPL